MTKKNFMANTLRLETSYLYSKYIFTPYLSPNLHINNPNLLLNLRRQSSLLLKYPPHFQLYVFIGAISPIPH